MRTFSLAVAAAAALMLPGPPARAGVHEIIIWKCDLATEKMPGMIRDIERKANAIPVNKRAAAARSVYWALKGVQSEVDSYSWYCGWSAKGAAAASEMRARLAAIRARFPNQ